MKSGKKYYYNYVTPPGRVKKGVLIQVRVKYLVSLMFTLLLFVGFSSFAAAEGNNDVSWEGKTVESLKINKNLSVHKLKDGRVLPVNENKAANLNEEEINEIISFMGHNPFQLPLATKKEIILEGGKAAVVVDEKKEIETYDTEGNLIGTEEVIEYDGGPANMGISSSGSVCTTAVCLSGHISASYVGKSGSNYKYSFYNSFDFSSIGYYYTDRIGLAWSAKATKVSGSDYGVYWFVDNFGRTNTKYMSINKTNIYGTVQNVNLYAFDDQWGYQKVQVTYPDRYKGDYDIFAGTYAHNWQTIFNSVSIGPASISVNNAYKKLNYEKNIKVGY